MSRTRNIVAGPAYGVIGMGMSLPVGAMSNEQIAERSGVDTEWILRKTGVTERRVASDDETTASMAAAAVHDTIAHAKTRSDVDGPPELLIAATSTPDRLVPAPAFDIHALAGLPHMPCLSIDGACAGIAQAMITAMGFYRMGMADSAVVVGSHRSELICDRTERKTAALFGDGAGAYFLGPVPDGYGILSAQMLTDSEYRDSVCTQPLRTGHLGRLTMDGRRLVETFASELPKMIYSSLGEAGLTMADVDRVFLHQGNVRMVEAFTELLGLNRAQVPITGDLLGNTASASLPITTVLSDRERPIERGEVIVLATAGAGVNGAVVVLRWY
ncbi:3-oxoacyl-ACP synthase III family protein [Gordonia zhaorongruii]|uniref:3-oxoacyl-ACP synthase III family protein n=1 Tax=Gordonia zhaorongruii TaxID=2597659 RepID=UPI00105406C5|nr:ketoacyl-ACP synthase III [Gordonia zhaorongruii]